MSELLNSKPSPSCCVEGGVCEGRCVRGEVCVGGLGSGDQIL